MSSIAEPWQRYNEQRSISSLLSPAALLRHRVLHKSQLFLRETASCLCLCAHVCVCMFCHSTDRNHARHLPNSAFDFNKRGWTYGETFSKQLFTRTWLRYVRVFSIANPSVCCLSSTQPVESFGSVSMPFCTLAIRWLYAKFYEDPPTETSTPGAKCKRGSQI